jgi:hypothetical protein
VFLYRKGADVEIRRDFRVGLALGHPEQDLHLPPG